MKKLKIVTFVFLVFCICFQISSIAYAQTINQTENGERTVFSLNAYRQLNEKERAKQKLKEAGLPEDCLGRIPKQMIHTAAEATRIDTSAQYYVEDVDIEKETSVMLPATKEQFRQATQKSLVSRGSSNSSTNSDYSTNNGALKLMVFNIRNDETGYFGTMAIAQWSIMPTYRRSDYLALSHNEAASPEPNGAECEYSYEYQTRLVMTDASQRTTFGRWETAEGSSTIDFNGLTTKDSGGYAVKLTLPKNQTATNFAPNTQQREVQILNYTAILSYSGNPTYPNSASFINHWATYFHCYKYRFHFSGISISIPLGGSVSISSSYEFNKFVLEHRYLYQPA